MDNAAEILTNCSTSNGILALAILIVGGVVFLWKQNKDNKNDLKLEIKEVKEELKDVKDELKLEIKQVKDELKLEITQVKDDVRTLSNKVSDIDKRVYGIEQILHAKECCILTADQKIKKAE